MGSDQPASTTVERRRRRPATVDGCLDQLPARVLLERMPVPALAVDLRAVIVYTNPAFAVMLGRAGTSLVGDPVTAVLDADPTVSPTHRVAALLGAAGSMLPWRHAGNEIVHATVSESMLMRADDPLVLLLLQQVLPCERAADTDPAGPVQVCSTSTTGVQITGDP